jgi:hypothetical protein
VNCDIWYAFAGSEASSTTASLHNEQHLQHHNYTTNHLEEDPEGISTSGQVMDDEGLLREPLFNHHNDDDDCDGDEDNDGYDDDEEEEEEDGEEDLVVAGPSRGYPAHGSSNSSQGHFAPAMPALAQDRDVVPVQAPSGREPSSVEGGSERQDIPPPAAESHEQPVAVVNGAVPPLSTAFKRPFNKKERLLETQQQLPSNGDTTNQSLSADESQPGPSTFRSLSSGGGHSSSGTMVTPVSRSGGAEPLATLISMELRRSGSSSSSSNNGGVATSAVEIFPSTAASLAPATLSVLTSGGVAGSSCSYYTTTTATKAATTTRSTPSVSLFPVDNHHQPKMIFPYQQAASAATQLSPSQGFRPHVSPAPSGPSAAAPATAAAMRLAAAPEKSYSASLSIGLAFSRLPGSGQPPTPSDAAALVSGPLSKRLRTRHYHDTVARIEDGGGCNDSTPPEGGRREELRRTMERGNSKSDLSYSLLPVNAAASVVVVPPPLPPPPPPPLMVKEEADNSSNGREREGCAQEPPALFLPLLMRKEEEDGGGGEGEGAEMYDEDEEEEEEDSDHDDDVEDDDGESGGRCGRYPFLGKNYPVSHRYH